MAAHLTITAPPVSAIRTTQLGSTGLASTGLAWMEFTGRRALRRRDFRAELRELLPHATGRHRATFIPLSTFALQAD